MNSFNKCCLPNSSAQFLTTLTGQMTIMRFTFTFGLLITVWHNVTDCNVFPNPMQWPRIAPPGIFFALICARLSKQQSHMNLIPPT